MLPTIACVFLFPFMWWWWWWGVWRQGVPELLLCAHELDEVVLRRLGPLEVHGGAVHHFRGQEETTGLLEEPVLRGRVLLRGDPGESRITLNTRFRTFG